MSLNKIELTDSELQTLTDVLDYAKGEAVTDRESAAIHNLHHEVLEQWCEERE